MQIFGGSSNRDLTEIIAKLLGAKVGAAKLGRFENGEARIQVKVAKVADKVILLQSLSLPVDEHLIEFCMLADALTREGASDLIGVIPWLGYSKQDKVFLPGEALAAKVVAQILQTTKVKKIITFDLHNRATLGFFDIPVTELSAQPLFLEYIREKWKGRENFTRIVVAPDAGAVKTSSNFAKELGVPVVYIDKKRDLATGEVDVAGMSGSVEGAEVIIADDMIVTGETLIETAKYLKSRGAKSVSAFATHHLNVPGVQEKLEASEIDEIVVTDTVSQNPIYNLHFTAKKLRVLSVAKLIVDELG